MRDTVEFLEALRQRGYDARPDETGVVTVWINPNKDDVESIRHLIKDALGWERSYGFRYTADIAAPDVKGRRPKAPDRDAYAAKTQRHAKPLPAAAGGDDQLPGQMDIFDFLGGSW